MVFRPRDFAAGDYFFQSRLPVKTTGSRGGAVFLYAQTFILGMNYKKSCSITSVVEQFPLKKKNPCAPAVFVQKV
jgi:hypothetical protein